MKIKEKQWGAKKNGCIFTPHTAKKKKKKGRAMSILAKTMSDIVNICQKLKL